MRRVAIILCAMVALAGCSYTIKFEPPPAPSAGYHQRANAPYRGKGAARKPTPPKETVYQQKPLPVVLSPQLAGLVVNAKPDGFTYEMPIGEGLLQRLFSVAGTPHASMTLVEVVGGADDSASTVAAVGGGVTGFVVSGLFSNLQTNEFRMIVKFTYEGRDHLITGVGKGGASFDIQKAYKEAAENSAWSIYRQVAALLGTSGG